MNTGEKQQSLQCANGLHYLKPHWKIIRDGFPLSVFDILSLFPLTTMVLLSAHDSLDSLDIVSLFIAIDATFIEIVHNAAGLSFQVIAILKHTSYYFNNMSRAKHPKHILIN